MTTGDNPARDEEPMAGSDRGGGRPVRRTVTVVNARGLHARAAAKFAKTAGRFKSEVAVTRGDQTVSGLSIMGLMMLAAAPGSALEITARGPDAADAIRALAALVIDRFDEDDDPEPETA